MNPGTIALLLDVAERLARAVRARDCPAVLALQGERTLFLSDYDYLRDAPTAAAFERTAADHARTLPQLHRWVIAVPQVWAENPDGLAARPVSNHPLRAGEQEGLLWTAYDTDDGIDYGIVPYTRDAAGEPHFAEPEIFTAPVRPAPDAPGLVLLRALLDS